KNILMVDSNGGIISNLHSANSKEKKFFQNFFRAFYQPIFNKVSGNKKAADNKKSDLLAGVQADEIIEVARSLLSAYKISVMAMSLASLDKFQGFGQQAYIYHKFIGKGDQAKCMLQVSVDLPSIERLCMLDWSNLFRDKRFSNLHWIIAKDLSASWFLRQPFWKANSYGKMGFLSAVYDFLPPKLLFYNQIGYKSQEPYSVQLTFADKEYLLVGMPGRQMLEYQFAAMIPLDNHYAKLTLFRQNLLLVMGAIFVLCSFIGFWLASTFIKPLKVLGINAEKVMSGNFSARFEAGSDDSEFIALSNNFNKIVTKLDTGQTLQKFVSDGALEVIQGNSEAGADFAALNAFSLFLRLDKFWDKTVHLSAEKAVYELNRFFSIICREASFSGGDVNKFIGEKAMAVFLCSNNEKPQNAALRVARFALKVRKAVERESDFFADCRLRIGITYGRILSGVIGAKNTRLEQTVIGDPVNMASRLCTLSSDEPVLINKNYADLINKNYVGSERFEAIFHSRQQIKGKRKPVEIYCLK
ncbi:MAG: adenylate/guanylate cyclase domain-containing protein, partial [Candidatus Rifleibacteriota bacterium]